MSSTTWGKASRTAMTTTLFAIGENLGLAKRRRASNSAVVIVIAL
jgi:hypothetical protein